MSTSTPVIRTRWARILVGIAVAVVTLAAGLSLTGTYDRAADPAGVPAGANWFMAVVAIALLVGIGAYAIVERLQTGRLDSIAGQFGTRTIVLIPIAIAINVVLGQTVAYALKLPLYLDSIGTILVGVLAGPIAGAATGLLTTLAWTFILAPTPFGSAYAWPFGIVAAEIGFVAGVFGYAGLFRSRPQKSTARLIGGMVVAGGLVAALALFGILPYYRDLCASANGAGSATATCFDVFAPTAGVDGILVGLSSGVVALVAIALIGMAIRLVRDRDLGVAYVLVGGAICGVISALIAAPIAALLGGASGSGTDLLVAAFQQAGSDLEQAVVQQALISDPIDKALTFLIVFVALGAMSRRTAARYPQGERALGTIEA